MPVPIWQLTAHAPPTNHHNLAGQQEHTKKPVSSLNILENCLKKCQENGPLAENRTRQKEQEK